MNNGLPSVPVVINRQRQPSPVPTVDVVINGQPFFGNGNHEVQEVSSDLWVQRSLVKDYINRINEWTASTSRESPVPEDPQQSFGQRAEEAAPTTSHSTASNEKLPNRKKTLTAEERERNRKNCIAYRNRKDQERTKKEIKLFTLTKRNEKFEREINSLQGEFDSMKAQFSKE